MMADLRIGRQRRVKAWPPALLPICFDALHHCREGGTMSSAQDLIADLASIALPEHVEGVARFYRGEDKDTRVMGVPIGKVFPVAKRHAVLPITDIEDLLDDSHYEVRMAAVAVMDFQARSRKITEAAREALFDLYLRRHDRIDNWDLVDRAAPWVIGEYLAARDRAILYRLACSDFAAERRTAIVSTYAFIRRGETAETFSLAAALAGDRDDYVQKAVASWVREAGKQDPLSLLAFLETHRTRLSRASLRDASKGLPEEDRARLLKA
jgi:3-methyladenine DNA glycosylase AlkD